MRAEAALSLRVLAGLHRGASLALEPGHWSIGPSLQQDLVLRDVAVPLVLELAAGSVQLQALGEGWVQDGAPLPPQVPRSWRRRRLARTTAATELACGAVLIELRWPEGLPAQTSRRAATIVAGFGASLAAIAGGWGVWGAGLPPPAEASAASTVASTAGAASSQNLLRLEHQLAGQRDWQRVTLVRQGSHGIELRGHVQHREALERLVQLPEVAAVAPLVRVVVEQELLRQVQTAVADPALLVAIEPAPSAAASAPLRVVVSGTTRRVGVGAALKLLNIEWGERVELLDRSVYAPEERDRKTVRVELPIRIASVNATERWIESSEGIRYFEGSVVSGYTVEAIEERQVVFKVADRRIEYRLP